MFLAPKGKSLPTAIFTATAPKVYITNTYVYILIKFSSCPRGNHLCVVAMILENIENADSTNSIFENR